MKHHVGQVWIRDAELRVCLDPEEGRYVTLMDDGDTWEWTIEERLYKSPLHRDWKEFWHGWEEMT